MCCSPVHSIPSYSDVHKVRNCWVNTEKALAKASAFFNEAHLAVLFFIFRENDLTNRRGVVIIELCLSVTPNLIIERGSQ